MNIAIRMEDTDWSNFMDRAKAILGSSDSLLKRAFLVVWPGEAASHFSQELGWDGPWAPWKRSSAAARISHEVRAVLGKQHADGRLSAADRLKGERKASTRRAKDYSRGNVHQAGGKLLQVSGRLRTETINEPIFTQLSGGLKVESPTPYSGWLDEGTSKMVARPFMWLGDEAQETLSRVFADYLGDAVGGTD